MRVSNKTIAVIGPDLSDMARAVADLASLFRIPIVSPSATNEALNDKTRFPHFFRTVAPDSFQAKLMIDLVRHFKWNYIALLTSDDDYGRSGQSALRDEIRQSPSPICTAIDDVINTHNAPEIIANIKKLADVKVVLVVFASESYLQEFIRESLKENLTGYTLLLSDSWTRTRFLGGTASAFNILGVMPRPIEIKNFRDELRNVLADGSELSEWSLDFICSEIQRCRSRDILSCVKRDETYDLSPFIAPTYNAVYAVAHALHQALNCSEGSCAETALNGTSLIPYLKTVRFQGVAGNLIYFDKDGNIAMSFQVKVFLIPKESADQSTFRLNNQVIYWWYG